MFNKFPFRVTLLLCLVLLFTAWNILSAWTALAWRGTLNELSIHAGVWIISIGGVIWSLTGLLLFWSIWQEKAWSKTLLFGAAAGYTIWYWGGRLIWQMPRPNWPFAVILNLVLIVFIIFTTKLPPREAYERKP
jgi:hypothetical protein